MADYRRKLCPAGTVRQRVKQIHDPLLKISYIIIDKNHGIDFILI